MKIIDHQHDRLHLTGILEECSDRVEQPEPCRLRIVEFYRLLYVGKTFFYIGNDFRNN